MASPPVDLAAEREKRKDRCMFCGGDPHELGPFTCQRLAGLDIDPDDGSITGVRFFAPHELDDLDTEGFDGDPQGAA